MNLLACLLHLFVWLGSPVIPDSRPVIEGGREAEIEALFSEIGKGDTAGWSVPDIEIPFDRIRAFFQGPEGENPVIELRFPAGHRDAVGRTPSFEVHIIDHGDVDPPRQKDFLLKVIAAISKADNGRFWKAMAGSSDLPHESDLPDSIWESAPVGERFGSMWFSTPVGRWFASRGGIATICWLACFWCLVFGVGLAFWRRKPWRNSASMRILIEIGALFFLALIIRQWIMIPGPGQMVARVPDPASPPGLFPQFGPGYGGWILGWFALLGVDDSVVFFAGALAGALTVIPVYVLVLLGGGGRRAGLFAGAVMALWPIHARLSPTNDEGVLIAFLVASSIALIMVCERTGARSLLVGGWLAGCLAATVRPEASLALLPLGVCVLVSPVVRSLQFRPVVLGITAMIGVVTVYAVYTAGIEAMSGGFSPWECLFNYESLGLFDLTGESILGPPRTPLVLTLLFLAGLAGGVFLTRGRSLLWILLGMFPSLPTACFAGTDIVTARYQMSLVPMAAVLAGLGLAVLGGMAFRVLPRAGRWLTTIAAAICLVVTGWSTLHPPPEPTFKLEYAFFREHLPEIPSGCKIVHIYWRYGDIGLRTPSYLSSLLDLNHVWIAPSNQLDTERDCVVYWQPASCRAKTRYFDSSGGNIMPECQIVESSYGMEPIAVEQLPARPEFVDEYAVDPVPVGFYRLRPKAGP